MELLGRSKSDWWQNALGMAVCPPPSRAHGGRAVVRGDLLLIADDQGPCYGPEIESLLRLHVRRPLTTAHVFPWASVPKLALFPAIRPSPAMTPDGPE